MEAERQPMEGLIEGRMVHFVMANGEHRPATIVRVWDKTTGYVNLLVFTDGTNDYNSDEREAGQHIPFVKWATSVTYSEEPKPRTWHWIEKA